MARQEFDNSLHKLETEIKIMVSQVELSIEKAMKSLIEQDLVLADEVIKNDDIIDKMQDDLEKLCIDLIRREHPLAGDLREIVACMYVIEELERIGDYAEGIAVLTNRMGVRPLPTDLVIIPQISNISIDEVKNRYKKLQKEDTRLDKLYKDVQERLIELMKRKPNEIERATFLLWVAHNLERIADRSINIAERSMFLVGN